MTRCGSSLEEQEEKSSSRYTKASRRSHVLRAVLIGLRVNGKRMASKRHDHEDTESD